jgi:hypothetical protein
VHSVHRNRFRLFSVVVPEVARVSMTAARCIVVIVQSSLELDDCGDTKVLFGAANKP